jgi:hypothetical protein
MKGWLVGILAWMLLLKKYYLQTSGGPLCINMLLNYVKIVTFANVYNLYGKVLKGHSNRLWHLNPSWNGVLILWDQSN